MKKEIHFNETELIGSMKEALAHAQEKLTLKTTTPPALIRRVIFKRFFTLTANARSSP